MAVAAELVHAASLIHDDIIDHAVVRRARAAIYREFGTSIAVLVGDVLYAQFFSLIAELRLPAEQRLKLVQLFCAVTKSMSQGRSSSTASSATTWRSPSTTTSRSSAARPPP